MEPLPSINKVFSMITQEEKQQEISVKNPPFNLESVALMTAPVARFVKQPYQKDKPVCTHCKVPGHTADKCYRLHGFPPGFKFTKNLNKPSSSHSANNVQESDLVSVTQPQQHDPPHAVPQLTITHVQCQQLLSLLQQQSLIQQPFANMAGSIPTTPSAPASISTSKFTPWIIDTGATDHMINCPSLFTTITAVVSTYVKLPNSSIVPVTHIGAVVISANLTLNEVLCVPSFTFNLISASKIIKFLKACLIFLAGFCFIQNLCPWRTIGVGREEGDLFYLL